MKPHDTALLREFLSRHGSPAVILRCPPLLTDSFNCPELPTADLDCHISSTDDLYSPRSPTTISDSPPPVLDAAFDPKLIYFNPSFSAWIRNADFPEKAFKEWAEDSSMWHDIRNQKTTHISYAHTIWFSYFIGGRWGILQSTLHWSQMDHMNTPPAQESDEEMKRIKRWRNPTFDALPLATPPLDIDERMRPRKRRRSSRNEEVSPTSTRTLTDGNTYFPQKGPSIGSMLARQGHLNDWTRYDIPTASEYIKFLRAYDWSKTAVGPMKDWSFSIRQNLYFIMSHPEARCVFFGYEDPIMLYNEAFSRLMGTFHPAAMGVSGAVGSGPAWEFKLKCIMEVMKDGKAREQCNFYHAVPRGELPLEEAHFSWWVMPIMDDSGCIFGALKEVREVTDEVLAERRDKTERDARDIMKNIQVGDKIDSYWAQVHNVVDQNSQDFPYCVMYSVPQDLSPEDFEYPSVENIVPGLLNREAIIGLEADHELVADQLDVRSLGHPLAEHFRSAWITRVPVLLRTRDDTLPGSLRIAANGRGLEGVCHSAIIYPLRRLDGPGASGFLLIGLNPQRNFDNSYRRFLRHTVDQFVRAAAVILVPAERERWKQAHEIAKNQELAFTRLAQFAPVGLALFEPTGRLRYCNPGYEHLSKPQKDEASPYGYQIHKHPDDRLNVEKIWSRLISSSETKTLQYQYRVPRNKSLLADTNMPEHWNWVFEMATKQYDELGNLLWITAFLTDATPEFKEQGKRLKDALETKQQSENFIDMTCHEMRNPLSAIIQSADGILSAFDSRSSERKTGIPSPISKSILDDIQASILDSAQTILLCAQHQKRIVDDTLTISKLESNLLLIAPERTQPVALVRKAVQMYDAELSVANIVWSFSVEESYKSLNIDFVFLDTSRLLQVLINLLTNAIKFTKCANTKHITIVLSATLQPPSVDTCDLCFIPLRAPRADVLASPEWGQGEALYLQFDVRDTGKGLTAEEMGRLFGRFQQASAKTAAEHGGSGLGLFISRELTELHGGQIGVSSVAGKGSTFAFYIKARRYQPEVSDDRPIIEKKYDDSGAQYLKPISEIAYADATISDTADPCADSNLPTLPSDLHILLVEDNLINQKVTAIGLRKVGCTVHVANHGVECLAFLDKTCYRQRAIPRISISGELLDNDEPSPTEIPLSVILLDQEMPVMDGLTCVRRIRGMQRSGELSGHIPVIACTGNARREQINVSLEAGMDEVVTKPFRINELLPKMLEVIQRVKMNDIRRISTESVGSDGAGSSNTSAASMGSGPNTLTSTSGGSSMAEI